MKNFKELCRKVFDSPKHLMPGDQIQLTWTREVVTEGGITLLDHPETRKEVLLSHPVTKACTFTEGVIFECEYEDRNAVGGLFLEGR